MAKPKITEVTSKIVDLLTPLDSEERQRVVKAALTLLGDQPVSVPAKKTPADPEVEETHGDAKNFLPKARTWIKQNQLTVEQLQQVFHVDGEKVKVIASGIPGKNNKEKSLNAYVLQGAAKLLLAGESSFDDKSASALCKAHGCYSEANHATYLQDKGNKFAGSKAQGWNLTAPGLSHAASLVKEISGAAK